MEPYFILSRSGAFTKVNVTYSPTKKLAEVLCSSVIKNKSGFQHLSHQISISLSVEGTYALTLTDI